MPKINATTLFPFIDSLKSYNISKAKSDFISALTVAIVASPQSMAYAMIAGVPPVYGLYASILPVMVAALFGSSKYLTAGPTNALSMVLYSSIAQIFIAGIAISSLPEEQRLPFIFMLSILTGIIQVCLGLSRSGYLANFISHSVMLAFTTGASLLIVVGQIKNFLGLDFPSPPDTFLLLYETIKQAPSLNLYTLAVGLLTLLLTYSIKKYLPKVPYAITSLIIVSILCAILGLEEKGVLMSPSIPQGFPPLFIPSGHVLTYITTLFFPALALAMLASVETIAIAKSMANKKGDEFDSNQELIGQGLGNIVGGFSSSIPGCGSFSRSAVNFTSGAKTRFSSFISGILTFFALIIFGPYVGYIPVASLAALLILICWNMISIHDIRFVISSSKSDCAVFFITFISIFLLTLEEAIFIGIIVSLSLFIKRQSMPYFHELEKEMIPIREDHPLFENKNFYVYCLEGPLFFGSVTELEKQLKHLESIEHENEITVILQMNRVNMIDASAAHALESFLEKMKKVKIHIIICSSCVDVHVSINKAHILDKTNTSLVRTMQEAFHLAEEHIK